MLRKDLYLFLGKCHCNWLNFYHKKFLKKLQRWIQTRFVSHASLKHFVVLKITRQTGARASKLLRCACTA